MSKSPQVVLVDDSKPFLMYLSVLLNRMNLEVLPVNSAPEALELARVTKPDIMIMDMSRSGMDGLEALREIRQDKLLADLPVILISSYADKSRQWEAMSLGCVDVLDKPIELRRLHKAIQNCNLYPGGPRRYMRVAFDADVVFQSADLTSKVKGVSLSERGIFVLTHHLLPKGALVEVDIPLPSGEILRVGGTVIYSKAQSGNSTVLAQGLAIKFNRMTQKDIGVLARLVEELLTGELKIDETPPTMLSL